MFTGKIDVEVLEPKKIHERAVGDINELLKYQHDKAYPITAKSLREHMQRSKVVVAWLDDRIIAMGVLVRVYPVSHTFGGIHNLIFRQGCDIRSLCPRLIELLVKDIYDLEYVDAHVWKENEDVIAVLETLGFKEKPKSKFRLRFKRK